MSGFRAVVTSIAATAGALLISAWLLYTSVPADTFLVIMATELILCPASLVGVLWPLLWRRRRAELPSVSILISTWFSFICCGAVLLAYEVGVQEVPLEEMLSQAQMRTYVVIVAVSLSTNLMSFVALLTLLRRRSDIWLLGRRVSRASRVVTPLAATAGALLISAWLLYTSVPADTFLVIMATELILCPASLVGILWPLRRRAELPSLSILIPTWASFMCCCAVLLAYEVVPLEEMLSPAQMRTYAVIVAVSLSTSLMSFLFFLTFVRRRSDIWLLGRRVSRASRAVLPRSPPKLLLVDDLEAHCGSSPDCPICLENLRSLPEQLCHAPRSGLWGRSAGLVGKGLVRLPCGHVFHGHCVERWLRRETDCPCCRRQVSGRACVRLCLRSPGQAAHRSARAKGARDGGEERPPCVGDLADVASAPARDIATVPRSTPGSTPSAAPLSPEQASPRHGLPPLGLPHRACSSQHPPPRLPPDPCVASPCRPPRAASAVVTTVPVLREQDPVVTTVPILREHDPEEYPDDEDYDEEHDESPEEVQQEEVQQENDEENHGGHEDKTEDLEEDQAEDMKDEAEEDQAEDRPGAGGGLGGDGGPVPVGGDPTSRKDPAPGHGTHPEHDHVPNDDHSDHYYDLHHYNLYDLSGCDDYGQAQASVQEPPCPGLEYHRVHDHTCGLDLASITATTTFASTTTLAASTADSQAVGEASMTLHADSVTLGADSVAQGTTFVPQEADHHHHIAHAAHDLHDEYYDRQVPPDCANLSAPGVASTLSGVLVDTFASAYASFTANTFPGGYAGPTASVSASSSTSAVSGDYAGAAA